MVGWKWVENMHEYLTLNGFKAGDELEFVRYHKEEHMHWGFPKEGERFLVSEKRGQLTLTNTFPREGEEDGNFILGRNWDFIFKLKEEKEEPKDIYTIAQEALEADGINVSRQALKLIAYRVVFGELLFEVMQKEKLDLQTTGAIIAALNKVITGE